MPLRHAGSTTPSAWVTRFAPLIAAGGEVLDFACGSGRHARWLVSRGFRVEAADRDAVALELLAGVPHLKVREVDLENGPWPYARQHFDGIVVTNYLFRPRLPLLLTALNPGGVLKRERAGSMAPVKTIVLSAIPSRRLAVSTIVSVPWVMTIRWHGSASAAWRIAWRSRSVISRLSFCRMETTS